MLRRTKSSSLLPIVRYFYPDSTPTEVDLNTAPLMDVRVLSSGTCRTPPPEYERLYQAMQLDHSAEAEEERVRKKYACQGIKFFSCGDFRFEVSCLGTGGGFVCFWKSRSWIFKGFIYQWGGIYFSRITTYIPPMYGADEANLSTAEKQRIHCLLKNLQPVPEGDEGDEPYPFVIFLFRQLGLLVRRLSPHVQSFAIQLVEFERRHNVARACVETGMGLMERGVDIAIKLGLNDALINFGTALGRGVGESYRVYKGT
jgi:hypothetical protein